MFVVDIWYYILSCGHFISEKFRTMIFFTQEIKLDFKVVR